MKTKRLSGDFSSQLTRANVSNLLTQLGIKSSNQSSTGSSSSSTVSPSLSPSSSSASMAATGMSTVKVSVGGNIVGGGGMNSTPSQISSSQSLIDKNHEIELTDMAEYRRSIIGSYNVRFIGSTPLRKRQTYPMLNWILTDLIYQSKCVGIDLSACITNCLMKENDNERIEGFKRLRQQLNQETDQTNNGLLVRMDIMLVSSSEDNSYIFQLCNTLDGQCLLRHKFSRIFLLGKYYRQPTLFYYIHKSDEDVVNAVPNIYLFQATNAVQQSEICMKFNELRCKVQTFIDPSSSNSKVSKSINGSNNAKSTSTSYFPLLDLNNQQLNINNNCFEVRHIGSVLITQKRSTPSMIDRAADKLHLEILCDYPSETDSTLSSDRSADANASTINVTNTSTTSNKPTVITTTARRQYRKNRFLVQVIEESNESTEPGCQSPTPPSQPPSEKTTNDSKGWSNDANSGKQEPNKTMLFIIGTIDICLISTENHRQVYSKVFANICHCSQGSKHADHFGIIVREPYVPPQPSGIDFTSVSQQSSAASTNAHQKNSSTSETKTNSDNYVLHIFQCQSESIANDLLCSLRQSFNNAYRHQHATAARAATAGSKDNSPSSAAGSQENLASAQPIKNPNQYCNNCPMNWFHQLCLDIYGLDDVKIFAMLLHRIRHGSSERRWREYHTVFEYLQLDRLEQRVDLLVIMLKARVERMQRYHEIRDGKCRMDLISLCEQIDQHDPVLHQFQQQKSTLSLNRLEGLRMMARSSLSNTFDAFRKRNRTSQSNENLQQNSAASSPSSSMMNLNSPTLFGGVSIFSSMLSSDQSSHNHDNHNQNASNNSTNHDNNNNNNSNNNENSNQTLQRRNTVADCGGDEQSVPLTEKHRNLFVKSDSIEDDEEDRLLFSNQKRLSPARGSRSNTPYRNQPLMDIYIKTSSGNAMASAQFSSMEELRQNLDQLLDPKLLATENDNHNRILDDGHDHGDSVFRYNNNNNNNNNSQSNSHTQEQSNSSCMIDKMKEYKNDDNNNNNKIINNNVDTSSSTIQMRHRLFRRIRKSLNQYKSNVDIENLINNNNNNNDSDNNESIANTLNHTNDSNQQQTKRQSLNDNNQNVNNDSCSTSNNRKNIRQLWQFAIGKQMQIIRQAKVQSIKDNQNDDSLKQQHKHQQQQQQQPSQQLQQQPQQSNQSNLTISLLAKSSSTASVTNKNQSIKNAESISLMDRINNLYVDIPIIETQSQLEMIILQWRKLIEMFDAYCHNNPGQSSSQHPQQSAITNDLKNNDINDNKSLETQAQNLHWWIHYERSIVEALRMGVPKEIRSNVWKFLAKYRRYRQNGHVENNNNNDDTSLPKIGYRKLLKQLAIHQHAIFVDLGRTFPTVPYFAEPMGPGQLALYNLLKAYSLLDKEVEYCQGLSFVAGILLLHMTEDDAFDQLCYVLYECGLREQYKPSMDALQMQMYQLNRLLYDLNRPLYEHLDRMDISPTLYAAPSFLTVFASQLPIGFVVRMFDLLMFYGMEAIFRVFYYLIDRIRDEILDTQIGDLENIMHLLRNKMFDLNSKDMAKLFDKCLPIIGKNNNNNNNNNSNKQQSIYSMNTRLEQYRLEYQILQEEFVHLKQINKLAVEQKLQLKQKQQQQQQKSLINNYNNSNSYNNNNINDNKNQQQSQQHSKTTNIICESVATSATNTTASINNETILSASCSAKLIECLRDENRKLREQMEKLQNQNLQLNRQIDELQLQVRRQSH